MEKARILIEVPDTGFRDEWDKKFQKSITRDYRARGLSRSESKKAAEQFIEEWRKLLNLRMK